MSFPDCSGEKYIVTQWLEAGIAKPGEKAVARYQPVNMIPSSHKRALARQHGVFYMVYAEAI
jgi:hypothetical protein